MKKINVIGSSGSGKSTFSKKLARKLDLPYIEMDAMFWGKNWYWPSDEEFFEKLEQALGQDSWVLDGNYTRTIPIKWKEVDTVIWIDFSFLRTFYQASSRAISRIISQEEIWPGTGNKETWGKLFSKDSIVLWMLKNYRRNKRRYAILDQNPAYEHIKFIRLRSPKDCLAFLRELD